MNPREPAGDDPASGGAAEVVTEPAALAATGEAASSPAEPEALAWGRPARWVLATLYVGLLVHQSLTVGLPLDRWRLLGWIAGALAISTVGRPWRSGLRLVVDWLPFVAVLVAYSYTRGAAEEIGMPVQGRSVVAVERALFLGEVPSVRLQRLLLPDGDRTPVGWWEIGVTAVYVSHFVVPYVLAAYLWVRDRPAWVTYVTRFSVLCLAAVVTFALLPTAPPWMAAQWDLVGELARPVGRGWELVSFHSASTWLDMGRAAANPVAAIPSLHAAFAALAALTLWPRVHRPAARAALVAYPVAMGFVLVYGGEHYVVDVLVGWLYVAGAVAVGQAVVGWRRKRRLA